MSSSSSSSSSALSSGMRNMSVHSDILSADAPSDPVSRSNMIAELKNRARSCVSSRDYPSAKSLYDKAIEVVGDVGDDARGRSVLHANRSLVSLQMNQREESLADAERAVELDATYVKGFWRAGQAHAALENWPAAVAALEKALALEPTNKALLKEADRCRRAADKAAREGTLKTSTNGGTTSTKATREVIKTTTTTTTTTTTKKSSNDKAGKDVVTTSEEDAAEFGSSDHVRGYKIVDGKKTSFFHHEQTEEEKRLIGDIAPKRLDPNVATAAGTSPSSAAAAGTSAWNKAGTWEEKDVTAWARESLSAQCLLARFELPASSPSPGSVASVTKVKKVEGHASTALARGKRRYIYELGVELEWEMTLPNSSGDGARAVGTMRFPDVDGTCDAGEYEMTDFTLNGAKSHADTPRPVVDRFVRSGGLRDEVVRRIDEWVELLKSTYA